MPGAVRERVLISQTNGHSPYILWPSQVNLSPNGLYTLVSKTMFSPDPP